MKPSLQHKWSPVSRREGLNLNTFSLTKDNSPTKKMPVNYPFRTVLLKMKAKLISSFFARQKMKTRKALYTTPLTADKIKYNRVGNQTAQEEQQSGYGSVSSS
jgi:hypothetical protein